MYKQRNDNMNRWQCCLEQQSSQLLRIINRCILSYITWRSHTVSASGLPQGHHSLWKANQANLNSRAIHLRPEWVRIRSPGTKPSIDYDRKEEPEYCHAAHRGDSWFFKQLLRQNHYCNIILDIGSGSFATFSRKNSRLVAGHRCPFYLNHWPKRNIAMRPPPLLIRGRSGKKKQRQVRESTNHSLWSAGTRPAK